MKTENWLGRQNLHFNLSETLGKSLRQSIHNVSRKQHQENLPNPTLSTLQGNDTHGILSPDCTMEFKNVSVAVVSLFMAASILARTSG